MELRLRLGSTFLCCDGQQGCACTAVSGVPEMKAAALGCRQQQEQDGEPVLASTESGGAAVGAASQGDDLGESATMLSGDTSRHTGSEREMCRAAGSITSHYQC